MSCFLAASLSFASVLPLVDPDEGRNAEIAREMVVSGDVVLPRLAGMPYLDKPPGLFWAEAMAMRALGCSPLAARLPSALSAAATLWLVGQLGLRRHGPGRALIPVLLLAVAPLFFALSAFVIFDMSLTLCVALIWTSLIREIEAGPSRVRRLVMYLAIAAGLLIKGPVVLAWAIGGSLCAALLVLSPAPLRWLMWWPGWVLAVLIAGGWFGAASWRCPEYPHYAFVEETWERVSSGSFHRERPAWFVPAVLIGGALPWSIGTPWTLRLGRDARVALGFVLFALVFFTVSRSDLVTYLLPALPPLAWVAGLAWSEPSRVRRGGWSNAIVCSLLAIGVVFLAPAAESFGRHAFAAVHSMGAPVGRALAIGLTAAAALSGAGAVTRRAWLSLLALVVVPMLSLPSLCRSLAPYAQANSGVPLAQAILETAPGAEVCFEHCYSPGTDFMLRRCSKIVSSHGHEITSTYLQRYRETLVRRGEWTLHSGCPADGHAEIIVRPIDSTSLLPMVGWVQFYRDARFAAYRRIMSDGTAPFKTPR